jgi:hypothetical protein
MQRFERGRNCDFLRLRLPDDAWWSKSTVSTSGASVLNISRVAKRSITVVVCTILYTIDNIECVKK